MCKGIFCACAGEGGSAAALLGRVSSHALAGLLAGARYASRVTVFPGSHPAQPSMATSAQRKACDPARALQLGLCRASPVVPRRIWKYKHLQFVCHLSFLFPVYTSKYHNSGIQCHLLRILLSEEDKRFDFV